MVPDLAGLLAFWDEMWPLPDPATAHLAPRPVRVESPAKIAREVRLRQLAAEQVAESRAARGVI